MVNLNPTHSPRAAGSMAGFPRPAGTVAALAALAGYTEGPARPHYVAGTAAVAAIGTVAAFAGPRWGTDVAAGLHFVAGAAGRRPVARPPAAGPYVFSPYAGGQQ